MYLSDNAIKKSKPLDKLYKLKDGEGFFLHVQPNRTKRFVLAYRFLGKQKSLGLGIYPQVSLSEARKKKEEARALLAKGVDPSARRKMDTVKESNADFYIFGNLVEQWWDFWRQGKRENTIKTKRLRVNKHILPYLHDRRIDEIKRIELVEIINRIVKDGSLETASKLSTTIGMIF